MHARIYADKKRTDNKMTSSDKHLANEKMTPKEQAEVHHQQTQGFRIASSSLTQLGMEVQPHSCNKVLFPFLSLLRYLQSCFQSEVELWLNGNPRSETLPDKIVRILLVLLSSYFFLFQSRFDILACPPLAKGKPGAIWYRAVSHNPEASVITYSHSLSFLPFFFFCYFFPISTSLLLFSVSLHWFFQAAGPGALDQIVNMLAKGLADGLDDGLDADSDDDFFEDANEDSEDFDFRGGDFQADKASLLALSKWPGFFSDDVSWRLGDVSLVSDDDKFRLDGVGFYLPLLLFCPLVQGRAAAVLWLGCFPPGASQVHHAREEGSAGIFLLPAFLPWLQSLLTWSRCCNLINCNFRALLGLCQILIVVISGCCAGGPVRVPALQDSHHHHHHH